MRRASVVLFMLALGSTASLAAQSDSTAKAPTFHPGQWAAQFSVNNGFYGIGVLRHRSPSTAWALNGALHVTHSTQDPGNYRGSFNNVFLSVGRRVYRPGAQRVRPFREFGVTGVYAWGSSGASGGYDLKTQSYGGGVYGQVGALIFFAPELGLGAAFNVSANYNHQHQEYTGAPLPNSNTSDYFSVDAGRVNLIGAFYF